MYRILYVHIHQHQYIWNLEKIHYSFMSLINCHHPLIMLILYLFPFYHRIPDSHQYYLNTLYTLIICHLYLYHLNYYDLLHLVFLYHLHDPMLLYVIPYSIITHSLAYESSNTLYTPSLLLAPLLSSLEINLVNEVY